MKKFHIISLGCPKNLVDSEVMVATLVNGGFQMTTHPEDADIIIVNTCTFILPAKEESIDEILSAIELKNRGKCRHIIVAGCLSQRYGTILEKEFPEVDLFIGTGEIPNIGHHIKSLYEAKKTSPRSFISAPSFIMTSFSPRILSTPSHYAYLKIAEGCSNRCSYCIIPFVRGTFRSRDIDDLVKEAETLANKGVKEVIITAQDTTFYGQDLPGKPALSDLLKNIASIKEIKWIRLLYTYPMYISDGLLHTISEEEKICNYIDIPIQHISDNVLMAMRRKGNSSLIRNIISKARNIIPDVALRTSLIVGFPGETDKDFNELLDSVKKYRFDHLGVFQFSAEEGTDASDLPNQVPEEIKKYRRHIIMKEQAIISYEINQTLIGSTTELLIEEKSDISEYDYVGRLKRQAPDIDGVTYVTAKNKKSGDIINCKITAADEYDLFAEEV